MVKAVYFHACVCKMIFNFYLTLYKVNAYLYIGYYTLFPLWDAQIKAPRIHFIFLYISESLTQWPLSREALMTTYDTLME